MFEFDTNPSFFPCLTLITKGNPLSKLLPLTTQVSLPQFSLPSVLLPFFLFVCLSLNIQTCVHDVLLLLLLFLWLLLCDSPLIQKPGWYEHYGMSPWWPNSVVVICVYHATYLRDYLLGVSAIKHPFMNMELKGGKISHLHHDVIWLLRLSRVIYTSLELPNLNMKGKTKRILVVVVKWRFRARVL